MTAFSGETYGSQPLRATSAGAVQSSLLLRYSVWTGKHLAKIAVVLLIAIMSAYLPSLLTNRQSPSTSLASVFVASAWGDNTIEIWWPTNDAVVSGNTPFKALLKDRAVDDYKMYWQVDAGQKNEMYNENRDWPHKEYQVNLSGWNWKGNGPYTITFTAEDVSGKILGQKFITIYVGGKPAATAPATPTPAPTPAPQPASPVVSQTIAVQTQTAEVELTQPLAPSQAAKTYPLDIWWPTSGSTISGTQPFKAMLQNNAVNDYTMYWQKGSDTPQVMETNYQDYPHKEKSVDVSGWSAGSYPVTFTAKNSAGQIVGKTIITLNIQTTQKPTSSQSTAPAEPAAPINYSTAGNILAGTKLYVNPYNEVKRQANAWRNSRPQDAGQLDKIADQPETSWFGGWNSDIQGDVNRTVTAVTNAGALPVLVAYNIPQRDCGGYSAGGTGSPEAYRDWIEKFAKGIGSRKAAVILEPDGLSLISCLNQQDKQTRFDLLKFAAAKFKSLGNTAVYIDAGHPGWFTTGDMISRLKSAGIEIADGFSLNIANFETTESNIEYGQAISAQVGGKHFVVDTGRNGSGPAPDRQWCNPSGRTLGNRPTTSTGHPLVDAYLWIKGPGGSDGWCNGGPSAGTFWPDYALDMARRS